ncbi:hypothetical protein JY651_27530 [Pyxidicoccus parkwayensis]|jgi:hypothetical protein|uniref:Uncharacterized protein n=1 Tax=Pyxidicoccus parkwayensis TaxID=2813578 RepID=A0ABX7NNQ8_9BACT|nr:hypothetical protein [Pyxidicoccus parkwaysis]QSQ19099.1 hypothetical protein JY651_27530 [Pyxidicoccus parkwaysis]
MADYEITMSASLDDVTAEQFTNICSFLNGQYGGSEDDTFELDKASTKPTPRSVNNAFAREGLRMTCVSIT